MEHYKEIKPTAGDLLTAFELEKERRRNMLVDRMVLDKLEERRKLE
jgi:hypothetical protein